MSAYYLDIAHNMTLWNDCIDIYTDSFPQWEREDETKILENITNGTYKMFCYKENGEVIGFYILDINLQLDYTLFSFLAIKESKRGLGLGSKLCLHAIEQFLTAVECQWLFIEAQQRQAKLYAKLGFEALELDYKAPAFNSKESIYMNLMLIKEKTINKNALRPIIEDIFTRGYGLDKNDIRLKEQLQRI